MSKDTQRSLDVANSELDVAPQSKRIPLHEQGQTLFKKEGGYFYYGFPNTKYHVDRALLAGYEFVTPEQAGVDEANMKYASTSTKNRVTVIANPRLRDETPYTSREQVFMRIPQELHDQDIEARAKIADDQERVMKRASAPKPGLGAYEEYSRE